MAADSKFYKCSACGNMTGLVVDKGGILMCCALQMTELIPNTAEASTEKHLPDVTVSVNDINVQIGSVPHPMDTNHHIEFVYVETKQGGQRKTLGAGAKPKCVFSFADDKPIAVYAYCNQHGLWKTAT